MRPDITQEIIKERRKLGERSLLSFARLFLSHHLKVEQSRAHSEIQEVLSKACIERNKKIAIAAPREFGKSTLITLIYVIYLICYSREKFIVIISHTAGQAQKILENIRKELTENERLKEAFPEIFESKGRPKPPRWTQEDVITRNNIEILALGYNQKIRGRRHGVHRPSLVILDDLEPDEDWPSSEQAEKMKNWINKAVLKVGSDDTNFMFIGTVHNWLSVLGDYVRENSNPGWEKYRYQALVEFPQRMDLWELFAGIRNYKQVHDGKTGPEGATEFYHANKLQMDAGALLLWPQKWSLLKLMEIRSDNEFSFLSEMQNDPRNMSEFSFNVDGFAFWSDEFLSVESLLEHLGEGVQFYMGCDPSMGKSIFYGDYSAIVVIACKAGFAFVIVADIARRSPDRLTRDVIAYAKRYRLNKLVIENNNFQELAVQALESKAREEGIILPIERVTNSRKKQERIFGLYDWVKNGKIKFNKADRLLLEQFRWFPQQGKSDDGPDALEMAFRFAVVNPQADPNALVKSLRQAKKKVDRLQGIILQGDQPFYDPVGFFRHVT